LTLGEHGQPQMRRISLRGPRMARSRRDLLGSVPCRKEGWSWQKAAYRSWVRRFNHQGVIKLNA